jgi:D-alanine-D-alanine ligase
VSGKQYGKVAVLMGGLSAEREISLKSGKAVHEALRRQQVDAHAIDVGNDVIQVLQRGNYDRAFIALHGRLGEDGVIQGVLQMLGLPHTGSGVLGSALSMDKLRCKRLWNGAGIPNPDYVVLRSQADLKQAAEQLGFPLIVKPAREGSSLGISKVRAPAQLAGAWELAKKYDDDVFAEDCIEGMELTAAILGDEELPLIRLETPREFYDYEAKYFLDTTRYFCPCGLDANGEKEILQLARRVFDLLGCSGWGRVDFMLDSDGNPYALEMNTVPGMTDHSLVPMAAKHAGLSFDQLVLRILDSSGEKRP